MRAVICFLLIGLMAGSDLTLTDAKAQPAFSAGLEIQSVADFYAPLAPYGTWVDVATYGHCWQPTGVPEGWRPYSNGSWEWTDLGWYWVSDEPWAWACYHYGTWIFDSTYGWLWVPGTEWAPAWVAWRESPDFIGWAPCTFDNVVIAPSLFVFVDIHRFHHRIRPDLLIINNPRLVERTRFVRNLNRQKHHFDGVAKTVVVNSGPNVQTIERAAGTRFAARPIGEVVTQTRVPETMKRSPIGKSGPEAPQPAQPTTPSPSQPVPPPTGREQPRITTPPSPTTPQPPPSQTRPPEIPTQPAPPTTPSQTVPPPTGREQPPITTPPSPTMPQPTPPSQTRPPLTPTQPATPPTAPSQPVPPPTGRGQPRILTAPSQTTTPPQVSPSETTPQWTPPTPQTMPSPTAPAQPPTVIPPSQTTLPQTTPTTPPSEATLPTRPSAPQPNVAPSITTPSPSAPVQPPPTQQPLPPTGREQGVNPGSQMPAQQVSPPREQSPASPGPNARPEGSSSGQQRMDNRNP